MEAGWRLAVAAVALAAVACGGGGGARETSSSAVQWQSDLDQALQQASTEGKLVMVDFYAEWCMWCRKLDETTYADDGVQRALSGNVIPVKLDAERGGRRDAARYRVRGFPTILFLDAQGREVGRIPGYMPPEAFLEELQDILARA